MEGRFRKPAQKRGVREERARVRQEKRWTCDETPTSTSSPTHSERIENARRGDRWSILFVVCMYPPWGDTGCTINCVDLPSISILQMFRWTLCPDASLRWTTTVYICAFERFLLPAISWIYRLNNAPDRPDRRVHATMMPLGMGTNGIAAPWTG
jgi:hypothetical protein